MSFPISKDSATSSYAKLVESIPHRFINAFCSRNLLSRFFDFKICLDFFASTHATYHAYLIILDLMKITSRVREYPHVMVSEGVLSLSIFGPQPTLSPKHPLLKMLALALRATRLLCAQLPITWTKTFVLRAICLEASVILLCKKEHTCNITCRSETDKFQRLRRAYTLHAMKIMYQSMFGPQCKVHLRNPQ